MVMSFKQTLFGKILVQMIVFFEAVEINSDRKCVFLIFMVILVSGSL